MGRLEEMQAFTHTAEAQSFTAAATRLGLSKSMVSQRVADLEARLGVRLLNRTTRRLSLTEAGQNFLDHAGRVLREADAAEEAAARHGTDLRGALRVAAPLSFGVDHIGAAALEFMRRHPGLEVHLGLDDRIVDLVQGGYDMAIRIGRLPDSALVARRLAPARMVCCASPEYVARAGTPIHPAELPQHEALIYTGVNRPESWSFQIDGAWSPVVVRGRLYADNGDMLLKAALAGFGIALLPSFIVGSALLDGRLTRLLPGFPIQDGAIHAVFPQSRLIATRMRLFIDFLAERFGGEPYWDQALCARFNGGG